MREHTYKIQEQITEKKVHFYLDKHFLEEPGLVGVHPNDNTATIFITVEDMLKIFDDLDYNYEVIEL